MPLVFIPWIAAGLVGALAWKGGSDIVDQFNRGNPDTGGAHDPIIVVPPADHSTEKLVIAAAAGTAAFFLVKKFS